VETSPTAHIRQHTHTVVCPQMIAEALGFECMECNMPLHFEYLGWIGLAWPDSQSGGHLDMNGKEYHQMDVCECGGAWSDRILMTIKGVRV
jgi:hypothetical protein